MSKDRKPLIIHSGHVHVGATILAAQAELPIIIAAGTYDRAEDHNPFKHDIALQDRFIHIQYECGDFLSREAREEFLNAFYPKPIDDDAGLTEWEKRAKQSREAKAALVAKLKGKRK